MNGFYVLLRTQQAFNKHDIPLTLWIYTTWRTVTEACKGSVAGLITIY